MIQSLIHKAFIFFLTWIHLLQTATNASTNCIIKPLTDVAIGAACILNGILCDYGANCAEGDVVGQLGALLLLNTTGSKTPGVEKDAASSAADASESTVIATNNPADRSELLPTINNVEPDMLAASLGLNPYWRASAPRTFMEHVEVTALAKHLGVAEDLILPPFSANPVIAKNFQQLVDAHVIHYAREQTAQAAAIKLKHEADLNPLPQEFWFNLKALLSWILSIIDWC